MRTRPSPATLLATLALVVAVGVPAEHAVAAAVTPTSVKKIAKKIADKEIKKKAARLSVAHAADADSLGGLPASGYARAGSLVTGESFLGWLPLLRTGITENRFSNEVEFQLSPPGARSFAIPISVPVQAAGRAVRLDSLRYCYSASAGAHLTGETVDVVTYDSALGTAEPVAHTTLDLADTACRTVTVNRVLPLHGVVVLHVDGTWTVANASILLGGVTTTVTPG